jgi:hypothetical protein
MLNERKFFVALQISNNMIALLVAIRRKTGSKPALLLAAKRYSYNANKQIEIKQA